MSRRALPISLADTTVPDFTHDTADDAPVTDEELTALALAAIVVGFLAVDTAGLCSTFGQLALA